ncbi:hypothetical protein OU416_31655 [Saccharopolyspora indica]|nr:hypothetical protein [Saccharopolyspora indica]MDA3648654.1 hypothetical protein [Saccharopolyspora indica]
MSIDDHYECAIRGTVHVINLDAAFFPACGAAGAQGELEDC